MMSSEWCTFNLLSEMKEKKKNTRPNFPRHFEVVFKSLRYLNRKNLESQFFSDLSSKIGVRMLSSWHRKPLWSISDTNFKKYNLNLLKRFWVTTGNLISFRIWLADKSIEVAVILISDSKPTSNGYHFAVVFILIPNWL